VAVVSQDTPGEPFAQPDLYSVDIATGSARLLMKNPGDVAFWNCDTNGSPVFAAGFAPGKKLFYTIDPDDRKLRLMASSNRVNAICRIHSEPVWTDRKYMISNLTTNTASLYELKPDGTQRLVYENEKFDVDNYFYDEKSGNLLGALCISDRREYCFIAEGDNILRRMLRHFKGREVRFISGSWDDRAVIVGVSDLGRSEKIYHYDDVRNLSILLYNEQERGYYKSVFRTESFTFKTRDGLDVSGYVTYPKGERDSLLPAVVLVHGGPWERDYARANQAALILADWGTAVVRINFRGSTGFGNAFEDAGDKQWGRAMQNDLEDGVAELVKRGVIDGDRVAIMGQSYGGYAAVQGTINAPKLYRCAISVCGIFDLYDYMANPPEGREIGIRNVHYKIGDPERDAEMLRKYSPINNYEKIQTPLLIFRGAKDFRNASIDLTPLIDGLNRRGIECVYKMFDDEDHVLVGNENLQYMYSKILYFLKKYIHLDAPSRSASLPSSPIIRGTSNPVQMEAGEHRRAIKSIIPEIANPEQIDLTKDIDIRLPFNEVIKSPPTETSPKSSARPSAH
jgi:dipeptidyl aminopeptidase/acylaminoacyl peptidase